MLNNLNESYLAFKKAYEKLKERISIQDEDLCYELTGEVIDAFSEIASKQWEVTKTLPSSWKFDLFSLEEYRKVWIALATLSYIHLFSSLTIRDALVRLKNNTIIQPMDNIISYVESMTNVDKKIVKNILEYITYEPEKKNVDIMYQPIVVMPGSIAVIAPILFVGSQPERNLLSVVSSKTDFEHSKEVNDLENLMVEEIEEILQKHSNLVIVKHRNLEGRLPDIDLGIYDPDSNAVLLCELKWFMAADSSREVYAREDDITHGCEQSSQIMAYAMKDKKAFMKKVFEVDACDDVDLFCCVVARHNIRTQNKYVPVIDLKKLKELFSCKSPCSVFYIIRNHEYEESLPEDALITYQTVTYGGFTFKIPAIAFGSMKK